MNRFLHTTQQACEEPLRIHKTTIFRVGHIGQAVPENSGIGIPLVVHYLSWNYLESQCLTPDCLDEPQDIPQLGISIKKLQGLLIREGYDLTCIAGDIFLCERPLVMDNRGEIVFLPS